jgi:hypothetical protein
MVRGPYRKKVDEIQTEILPSTPTIRSRQPMFRARDMGPFAHRSVLRFSSAARELCGVSANRSAASHSVLPESAVNERAAADCHNVPHEADTPAAAGPFAAGCQFAAGPFS